MKGYLVITLFTFLAHIANAQEDQAKNAGLQFNWSDSIARELDERVASYMELTHTAGVAIAIIHDNTILKRSFYGLADVANNKSVTEQSEFWLASISKHISTALVLDLEEDGLLSVSDSIIQYLPELPASWSDIRIEHLMSHTSGIIDNQYSEEGTSFIEQINTYAPGSPNSEELISLFGKVGKSFPAGEKYIYSDIGMMVLAVVASRAAEKSFDKLMQERIFAPANMSSYINNPSESHPDQVKGYTWSKGQLLEDENRNLVTRTDQRSFGAAGSLFVTLDDMINWNHTLNENLILSRETKELLWDNYQLASGEKLNSGLGLNKIDYPGGYAIGHNGIAGTEYWKFLEYNLDIIILTNHGMNLASFGLSNLVAETLALLDDINAEILINKMEVSKTALDNTCLPLGKYMIRGPFPIELHIEFYIENETPYVMIQGLLYELIPLENCAYLGFSKAIFFPASPLPIPHFVLEENTVNWLMGDNKLALVKLSE